ncbi:conserved hypothetical protein [Hyella patelloides LEGE 07179]|uniref:DUF4164 domain-containing protein n=1 Tax=Hyella patelloides LEGE 07179 TaxID=945734 RepID=A0A563W0W2_9CYAN|nr:hypothetical protein [Hyella patelloides]VEP17306.1 conserved hypothetical protein [Hyella patelloides LEGE 07179]
MNNPTIETDIAEILRDLQSGQKEILKEISDLKVSLETVKGDLKALDTKVEQLDKRVGNSELTNRGILIGLVVVILGGTAKLWGWMPNS